MSTSTSTSECIPDATSAERAEAATTARPKAGSSARGLQRAVRTLLTVATVVVGILAARSSLADHYTIPSGSMLPTIHVGDRVAVNKSAYGLRVPFTDWKVVDGAGPRRGDVVILESPEDGTVLIKRVVGLPGDRVAVHQGQVQLDGRWVPIALGEEGLVEALGPRPHPVGLDAGGGPDFGPVTVPDGHYLVLGDNRGESRDGRSFGFVPRSAVLGKAVAVYHRDGAPWPSLIWKEL